MKEHATTNREKLFFEKLKTHKLILKSISRTANLARGSVHASKIRWAHGKNYSTQISNQGTQAQAQDEVFRNHKFPFKNTIFLTIEYKMCLKILQKLRCLVGFQNRQSAPIGHGKNLVNFEFLKGNLVIKAFLCPLKENWAFFWTFSFLRAFSWCVFSGALALAKRAPWVRKFGNLCIRYLHPRNNDSLVIVRLPDRPTSAPQAYQCEITQSTYRYGNLRLFWREIA